MTHDEAFIQSIREAPSHDAPRLIYADWLEEHGQAERAEFIRVQCRLADPPQAMQEHALLMTRAEELLRRNWAAWVGPLREIVGPRADRYGMRWLAEEYDPRGLSQFQRGFVESLTLDAEDFLQHARKLTRLTPLRNLCLWGAGRCAGALGKCPALAGLLLLDFHDFFQDPLTARDASVLANSPYLRGLHILLLGRNALGDEGVEALARAPWLVSLMMLDLVDNGLSDRAAQALASSPYLGRLCKLELCGNSFTPNGIAALKAANFRRVHYDLRVGNGTSGENDQP